MIAVYAEIEPDPEIEARTKAEREKRLARQLKKRGKSIDDVGSEASACASDDS